MPRLRELLESAGFSDVRTYVQSGNVVLGSQLDDPDEVAAAVRSVVADEFGVDTLVVVRTPQQIRDILAWNPFSETAATSPTTVHVAHLDAEPDPDKVEAVLATDWSPDELVIHGTEACIRYAKGMHGSRLHGASLLKRLGVDGTVRNWRTVSAIADLLR